MVKKVTKKKVVKKAVKKATKKTTPKKVVKKTKVRQGQTPELTKEFKAVVGKLRVGRTITKKQVIQSGLDMHKSGGCSSCFPYILFNQLVANKTLKLKATKEKNMFQKIK